MYSLTSEERAEFALEQAYECFGHDSAENIQKLQQLVSAYVILKDMDLDEDDAFLADIQYFVDKNIYPVFNALFNVSELDGYSIDVDDVLKVFVDGYETVVKHG